MDGKFEARNLKHGDGKDSIASRKIQKADREKLRRDHLNEQFAELSSVLDPNRPKNDKATIVGDTIQILKDLTEIVKQLESEQSTLVEESHNLTNERNELQEEKMALKSEVDQLRSQYEQCLQTTVSCSSFNPTLEGASFSCSMPIPLTPGHNSDPTMLQGPAQPPVVGTPLVSIPVHPSYHVYPFFGSRTRSESSPYLAFPSFPSPMNTLTGIERPSPQYPPPVQPIPAYLVRAEETSGNQHLNMSTAFQLGGAMTPSTIEESSKSYKMDKSPNHFTNNKVTSLLNECRESGDQEDSKLTDLELKMSVLPSTPSSLQIDQSSASRNQELMQDVSSNYAGEKCYLEKENTHIKEHSTSCVEDSASSTYENGVSFGTFSSWSLTNKE